MPGDSGDTIRVSGQGRVLGAGQTPSDARVDFELGPESFSVNVEGRGVTTASYRDLTTIAVDQGRLLVVLGGEYRLLVEQLGDGLGTVLGVLRDRRARQMLHDRFVELDPGEAIELVEYVSGDEHGVAQIAYHPWGVALLPLDERLPRRLVRRADVGEAALDAVHGSVAIDYRDADGSTGSLELRGLGRDAQRHHARLAGLRDAARADSSAIITSLMPDAPFADRQRAAGLLIDGRPVSPDELGHAWPTVRRAVLVEPVFAQTYASLVDRGSVAGEAALQWLAISPATPGGAFEDVRYWFLVGLPGNLLAMELVQQGSHATYLFRVVPRATYRGETPTALAERLAAAVTQVSECLLDTRFLREPIYLTDAALADARYLRYRLAIAILPSLRAVRARFVGRLIHRDDDSWSAALDEAIRWNAASQDDRATWPGGAGDSDADESAGPQVSEGT